MIGKPAHRFHCGVLVLSFSLLCPQDGLAAQGQKGKGRMARKGKARAPAGPPLPPPQINLQSLDLSSGMAHVEVSGSLRAPESRFFTLTDERKRRFVPSLVECGNKQAGMWHCSLGIPRIYQRAVLVNISVEVRGQTVSVPGDQVRNAWAEARATTPLQTVAERPRDPSAPWGMPHRTPDGGPTLDSDGTDSEAEEE